MAHGGTNTLSPSIIVIDIGTNDVSSRIVISERLACQIAEVAVMFRSVSSVETTTRLDDLSPIDEERLQ